MKHHTLRFSYRPIAASQTNRDGYRILTVLRAARSTTATIDVDCRQSQRRARTNDTGSCQSARATLLPDWMANRTTLSTRTGPQSWKPVEIQHVRRRVIVLKLSWRCQVTQSVSDFMVMSLALFATSYDDFIAVGCSTSRTLANDFHNRAIMLRWAFFSAQSMCIH